MMPGLVMMCEDDWSHKATRLGLGWDEVKEDPILILSRASSELPGFVITGRNFKSVSASQMSA